MRQLVITAIALSLCTAGAPVLSAQVGYPPERSPFQDLEYKQEVALYGGYFLAQEDRAGVAPRSAPLLGARYEVRIGGPAQFTVRAARTWSERMVLDPAQPEGQREVGTRAWPLYLLDLGITLNLTGQKSFHGFVPVLNGGIGVVSDLRGSPDVGGFKFGTQFAFSVGGGVRWVPRSPLELRVDLADYLYQVTYPSTYLSAPSGETPVLGSSQGDWTHNLAITAGVSYRFFR